MGKIKDAKKNGRKVAKTSSPTNGETLRSALTWIVTPDIFQGLDFHGNTKWVAVDLVILAVLWVWSDDPSLKAAFGRACGWAIEMFGRAAVNSYPGFTAALVTWTGQFLPLLWNRLHFLMEQHGSTYWRVGLWVALAVDGSRISVPRTAQNEQAFCAKNYGRGKTSKYRKKKSKGLRRRRKLKTQAVKPQIWMTLLWHMGLRLPWCWKTGPSDSSERDHFQQMLKVHKFPENTLFCADAGFVGYDLWKEIIVKGHSFLIRVGSNVTLLRKLGYVRERDGYVYYWPDKAVKKKQPPLVLRLLHFQLGRCQIYLVTNVLEKSKLSISQAKQLYQLRWGIELQYRTLKQTFGRRKLRSRTPECALVELDWSIMGLWMIQFFAAKEQIAIGEPPKKSSAALAIRVIRDMFHHWSDIPAPGEDLSSKMKAAVKDEYDRKKPKEARYKPNFKDKPSAGPPKVILADRNHNAKLQKYLSTAA